MVKCATLQQNFQFSLFSLISDSTLGNCLIVMLICIASAGKAKYNREEKTFYSFCIIDWSSAKYSCTSCYCCLFTKSARKNPQECENRKDICLGLDAFAMKKKGQQHKSHLTAAGNDAIKKLFPTPEHFCANTKQLLTRLGYRTVENYSIVASLDHDCVPLQLSLFVCLSFSFFVYLSIENLPFTIQSRSDDKSDSKSCDITTNPLLSNETMSIAFSSLLLIL